MKAKSLVIPLALLALAGGGAFMLYQGSKAPELAQIRANPTLFQFEDYKDKVALHTRLSTLFPRGTQEETIANFFNAAGHRQIDANTADCLITLRHSRARFHLSASEKNWSRYRFLIRMDRYGQALCPIAVSRASMRPNRRKRKC